MTRIIRRIKAAVKSFHDLTSNCGVKTFYPDEQRKTRARIIRDQLAWLLKHHELNHFYYLWGFDRASFDRPDKYLPEQGFCRLRDKANACRQFGTHRARYICMLQDKFVFGQYLKSLGFVTPEIYALADAEGIDWIRANRRQSWDQLAEHEQLNAFLKDALGRCGKAVFPIEVRNGQILVNGKQMQVESLRRQIDGKYIIQERVVQHPEMSRLYPYSVNTLRLVTLRRGTDIILTSGTLRMGAARNPYDNWSSGGIGVGIYIEDGRLKKAGMFRDSTGGRTTEHPETKVVFETFQIPFFSRAAELVKELHAFFYGVQSIGWDVAITEQGPTVIEGNNSWCIGFQQIHDISIKQTFLASLTAPNKPQ
ncbi:MAG: hypothetical protein LLF76_13205 [Planctomycetaceae bacterium]|nr:hypothetical protein [Planctomycetaceae bacterium]